MKIMAFLKENTDKGGACEFGSFTQMRTYNGGHPRQTAYFFLMSDNSLRVRCGRFAGTMQEWAKGIMKEYGRSQTAREYLAAGFAACVGFGSKAMRDYLSVWDEPIEELTGVPVKKTPETVLEADDAPDEPAVGFIQEMRTSQIRVFASADLNPDRSMRQCVMAERTLVPQH